MATTSMMHHHRACMQKVLEPCRPFQTCIPNPIPIPISSQPPPFCEGCRQVCVLQESAAGNPNFDASRPSAEQQDKQARKEKLEGTSFKASTTLNEETALSLYKLARSQSFWETKHDTRCLVGWGNTTVVVAFRGTASMKNALADLQVPCCDQPAASTQCSSPEFTGKGFSARYSTNHRSGLSASVNKFHYSHSLA